MARFKYTARSKSGEKLSGTVAASSTAAAIEEIQRMGLFPVAVDSASDRPLPSQTPATTSILFPKKVERLEYFIRWLLCLFTPGLVAALLLPLVKSLGIPLWFPLLLVLLLVPMRIPCADIPRFRSIGWSPWLLLLLPVPFVGLVIQLLLFFVPAKEEA